MIAQSSVANDLLTRLDVVAYREIMVRAVEQPLALGVNLATAGEKIEFCWFPTSGLVSIIALDAEGGEAEVGMIGREGIVNLPVVLGDDCSALRVMVQVVGSAIRVEASAVRAVMAHHPAARALFLAYVQVFTIQVATSAIAYARYSIDKRLARWILMCGDRVGDSNIGLTHEALSIMLGVRRASVTVAVSNLAKTGAIIARRSHIAIANRPRLLRLCASGYGLPEREYVRLIGVQAA
ncbi:Crp/Fnr family transcriptional regulator [Glacieibacterium megasporae]|uniref:Crp/Fnr family transcriptional regulator n=1 Tax=Glacieibacterium megasporae TaxID=2835787 RepID=UPI001CAA5B4E|nr:Crp/Fnr family transcriptional regulator [Polymorphobacter megasporae]UAJ12285.1 Crp/Fnr family transcriptional regulator [Polymorphobacter megasporae]